MESRAISPAFVLIGALGAAGLSSFFTSGCSGPNPAAVKYEDREGENPVPSNNNSNNNNTGTDGGGTTTDPGTGDDGGTTTTPVQDSAVFGSSTLAYAAPAKNANDVADHGGAVSGKDCVVSGCHLTNAHQWSFAGTVFTSTAGTTPVTKAEVKVVGPDGTPIGSAYTDTGGNFWLDAGKTIPAGSKVGVRTDAAKAYMITGLGTADKGCNANKANCHGTSATGKIHVP